MNGMKLVASSKNKQHNSLWKLFQQDLCDTRKSAAEVIASGERGTKDEEDARSMRELEECSIRFSSEEKESVYIFCHQEFSLKKEETIEKHHSHPQTLAESPKAALLVGHFIQDTPDFLEVPQQVLPCKHHHPSSLFSSITERRKEVLLPRRRFHRSCESMDDIMLRTVVDAAFDDSRHGRMIATENAIRLMKMDSRPKWNRCFAGGLLRLYSEHYEHYHQDCFHPPQLGQSTACHRKHKSCSGIDESRPCALRMSDSSLKEEAEEMDRLWQDHNDAFPDYCRQGRPRHNHSPSLRQKHAGRESDKKSKASWKKMSESKGSVLMSLRSQSLGLGRILSRCLSKPL